MGGMGFIEYHKADCMLSVLINTHLLLAARDAGVHAFSSRLPLVSTTPTAKQRPMCVRSARRMPTLRSPEDGYGWEKLFSERMCRHFNDEFGLTTRVARYHNVYGPQGTWDGGREKAPAAVCRKVAQAVSSPAQRDRDLGRR